LFLPSSQLDLSEDEPAQQQQDSELALFHDNDHYFEQITNNLESDDDNFQPGALVSPTNVPADWEDASPDVVLAKLKQIKQAVFERCAPSHFISLIILGRK
jgi:hypothetical protein